MEYIVCKNCNLPYDHPRILPCGHYFCSECLHWIIAKKSFTISRENSKCLFCPTCQQLCEFNPAVGVRSFKPHALVESLVDFVFFRSLLTCQKCCGKNSPSKQKRNTVTPDYQIVGCCFRCQSLYCRNCKKQHDRSDHSIAAVDELRKLVFESLKESLVVNQKNYNGNPSDDISCLRIDDKDSFEPTMLAIGPKNEVTLGNRRGQIRMFTKKREITKMFNLLNFQSCNYGRMSPCNNISIWAMAFNSNGHVVYTIQHRCSDDDINSRIQIALIQSVEHQAVGECILKLDQNLSEQLKLHPRNIAASTVRPRNILILRNGSLLISDVGLHCIHMFDSKFDHVRSFGGSKTRNKMKLNEPRCLAERFRNLSFAVVNAGDKKIKVFSMGEDMKVSFEMEIPSASFPSKNFHPYQLSCDTNDNFYVMERHSKEIHVFNERGQYVMHFSNTVVSFEIGDVMMTSSTNGPIFLMKSKLDKSVWHISHWKWSIVHRNPPRIRENNDLQSHVNIPKTPSRCRNRNSNNNNIGNHSRHCSIL